VTYTNAFFTSGTTEPEVILEDQGGFVTRDRKFVIPIESQVIGQITSDFFTSPFSYSLSLPALPQGTLRDVDHDGQADTGVMVFAVAYWTNTWGDPYLERRDQGGGGWSTAYASTRVSSRSDSYLEVTGGKYVVFAPDAQQQFPSGFGADAKLFTDDDPLTALPSGWSVIDLDQPTFTVDQTASATIDLIEPDAAALDDFSGLEYAAAFDKMLDKFEREYAFTEFKHIDWAAKGVEFRPRFEDAERNHDAHAYALALRDFTWSIPDAHVGMEQGLLQQDFYDATLGGLGLAIAETDDGRFFANYLLTDGPAEHAGMEWGAEITGVDGRPTADVVDATVPWSGPFSNATTERLQKVAYALRFPLEKGSVSVEFKNPNGASQTATIALAREYDSLIAATDTGGSPTSLPVEFRVLDSGIGYLAINSFSDNDVLSIQVWERAIKYFRENNVSALVIDMRHNSGGSGWLARYDEATGAFFIDPGEGTTMIPPAADLQYTGNVAVLVGPGCASACEFFSYFLTVDDRATIVGLYPTDGAGGSVEQFLMPENIHVQITTGRSLDANGEIHLEGKGVVPTVRVPVTFETLQSQHNGEDAVLSAAEAALH